jgi:hypothetical protein
VTLEQLRLRAWRHSSRLGKRADKVVAAISRVRLAAYVAWLALTGDTTFFQRWEARHVQGVERYMRDHRDAKELWRYREALAGETSSAREAVKQLGALRIKVKEQARTISNMQEVATLRNKQMDALHMVWCSGGCAGGVGDRENLTRDKVLEAVRYTSRLVEWWNNHAYRDAAFDKDDEKYRVARVEWAKKGEA